MSYYRSFPISRVVKNYDGDTVTVEIDLGFNIRYQVRVRVEGVNTPELRGGTPETRAAGRVARDEVRSWLSQWKGLLSLHTTCEHGKYGRVLGDIRTSTGKSLAEYILRFGYGVPYED